MTDALTPVQIVLAQLEAFNRHDLGGVLARVADNLVVTDAHGAPILAGRDAMREAIRLQFAVHPGLKSDLLDRMSLGEWVIDETMITGYEDDSQIHLIAIMRVLDGRIAAVRVIRG